MAKINGNVMAQVIAMQEGKKVEVNIAQISELIRLLRRYLSKQEDADVLAWVHEAARKKRT